MIFALFVCGKIQILEKIVNPSQILDVRYGVDYRYGVFRKERLKLVPKLVKLSCLDFVDAVRGCLLYTSRCV